MNSKLARTLVHQTSKNLFALDTHLVAQVLVTKDILETDSVFHRQVGGEVTCFFRERVD